MNDKLGSAFPCDLCWVFGYIMSPFTFGLSLLCPAQCVNNAERYLRDAIWRTNQREFRNNGIEMALVKQCGTSWIEIRLPKDDLEEGDERLNTDTDKQPAKKLDNSIPTTKETSQNTSQISNNVSIYSKNKIVP